MRYRFYREHKYVSAALNDLEREIARADFADPTAVAALRESFRQLKYLLEGHADYEEKRLHKLLENKNSYIHLRVEAEHTHQDEQLDLLQKIFDALMTQRSKQEMNELGYHLYLNFRKFVADNLSHLHEEETIILPELQRLYSDEELREVEAETYRHMTPDQILQMIQTLFPHMNPSDHEAFIMDIKRAEPDKFILIWPKVQPFLRKNELQPATT